MSKMRFANLSDGSFRLDGGAMFGVVPRVVWETSDPPDDRNRILLGLNCLLIQGEDSLTLVDTGVGDKEGDTFADRFALIRQENLFDALAALGLAPSDVTHVINTHLHFDHCGGNTRLDESGEAVPSFANAKYYVQRGEWEDAIKPNERTRASYLQRNFRPLQESGQLELVDGEAEILPGIRVLPTPGHTPHHQSLLVETGGAKVFYPADLIPTSSHLPLPFIMSYDLEPVRTLETKRQLLERQREEGWLLYFEHERETPFGKVNWTQTKKGERPVFEPLPMKTWFSPDA